MVYPSQNLTYEVFKARFLPGLKMALLISFFLQSPVALIGYGKYLPLLVSTEYLDQSQSYFVSLVLVLNFALQVFLLYALYSLLTKNPRFGLMAAAYCGSIWISTFVTLLLDAWLGFLTPVGVAAMFGAMQWWVVWFFFFHGVYL